jgi:hypothetical protein
VSEVVNAGSQTFAGTMYNIGQIQKHNLLHWALASVFFNAEFL